MELTRGIGIFFCCHLLASVGIAWGDEVASPPSVDVQQIPGVARLDLGCCAVNEPVLGKALLINQTQERWTIRKVETDCGCLSADVDSRSFDSGQTVRLDFQLAATGKIAKVRRSVRIFFAEADAPLLLYLDLSVMGPVSLDRSVFDVDSRQKRITVHGRKRHPGLRVETIFSGRGGFLLDGEVEQDEESFRFAILPLHQFGAFSDVVRIRLSSSGELLELVELPIELRSVNTIRFLPSTLMLQRDQGQWVGQTRMIVSPEADPIDLKTLRFDFTGKATDSGMDSKSDVKRGKVNVHPLSSVLSIVQVAVPDEGRQSMPHFVEIEDRNGSLLGTLYLSPQGLNDDAN
jgi:hypothetical protein